MAKYVCLVSDKCQNRYTVLAKFFGIVENIYSRNGRNKNRTICNFFQLFINGEKMDSCKATFNKLIHWHGTLLKKTLIKWYHQQFELTSFISLWTVVNLNSNGTCPVCTGLSDNSVYWPDSMVQYVALIRLTYFLGIVPSDG